MRKPENGVEKTNERKPEEQLVCPESTGGPEVQEKKPEKDPTPGGQRPHASPRHSIGGVWLEQVRRRLWGLSFHGEGTGRFVKVGTVFLSILSTRGDGPR